MGMCKGCNQIFKTEDMIHNFCVNCQKTEEFKKEINLIDSGYKRKNQLKDKKFFYTIICSILFPIGVFFIYGGEYHIALVVLILPLLGLFSLLEDIYYNNKQIKEYENKDIEKISSPIKNKKEILVKSLIILSIIWLLLISPIRSYEIRHFIEVGIIPVVLVFGIIWIYFAYSKNKTN